jgi:hypothetical protein
VSRTYANISTAIWRRDEFRALDPNAQWMYLLLTSQPEISAAGVLPLSITRWSTRAKGVTPEMVVGALQRLQAHRYVVLDFETEEVLVRSFVRWDGGYTNPKRRPVIQRAAEDVESKAIRRSLAAEFRRLGLPEWLSDSHSDGPPPGDLEPDPGANDEAQLAIAASFDPDLSSQGNTVSDTQSDGISPSDGVVVTQGLYLVPQPTTRNPQPTASPCPDAAASITLPPAKAGATHGQRAKAITDAYATAEPMSKWPAVNAIVLKTIKLDRWTDQQIHDALQRMAHDGRSVTVDSLRIELTGPPVSRASPAGLVEHNGMQLKPITAQRMAGRERFAAADAAAAQQAIGATP